MKRRKERDRLSLRPAFHLPAGLEKRVVQAEQVLSTICTAVIERVSTLCVFIACTLITRLNTRVSVEGLEHIPSSGPLLLVARHFHHLYDGSVLVSTMPRTTHILVALDWVRSRRTRAVMERVCALAHWPVVLRSERLDTAGNEIPGETTSAYTLSESRSYLRRAITESVRLLRKGEALVVFPEAYPTIDPLTNPKEMQQQSFLPFRSGFARLVEMAERDQKAAVAVVPVGFTYTETQQRKGWNITLRIGPAHHRREYPSSEAFVEAIEQNVQLLSR